MNFINFNEHILASKRNVYGGSDRKRTVILDNNQQYLLKFPDPTRELNRDVSYINNAISEYLGCCVFRQGLKFKIQSLEYLRMIMGRKRLLVLVVIFAEQDGRYLKQGFLHWSFLIRRVT